MIIITLTIIIVIIKIISSYRSAYKSVGIQRSISKEINDTESNEIECVTTY